MKKLLEEYRRTADLLYGRLRCYEAAMKGVKGEERTMARRRFYMLEAQYADVCYAIGEIERAMKRREIGEFR